VYALLPSTAYFNHVADKVATFKQGGMSQPFYNHFPAGIGSWSDLEAFASDAYYLDVFVTDPDYLDKPLALSPGLLSKAAATHATLDAWAPPPGLRVVSLAGWGQLTIYRYDYAESTGHRFCWNVFTGFTCETKPQFIHTPQVTEDGDGTVVSPSALGAGGEVWYFDEQRFSSLEGLKVVHKDMTSAFSIQNTVLSVLMGTQVDAADKYLSSSRPSTANNPLTVVGAASPVNLLIKDMAGNETGIVSVPDLDGIFFKRQDIPGSSVEVSGENKFVFLPSGISYSVTATGYASGPATLFVSNMDTNGTVIASTTIADIPVATSTAATFTVSQAGAPSAVAVDLNGDGFTDTTVTPQVGVVTLYPYRWEGFLQPINDTAHQVGQSLSVFKAGSTVPVKFQLKNSAGFVVQAAIPPQWLPPQKGSAMSAPIDESLYSGTGTSGTAFRWDSASAQYIYNWSTKGLSAGYWYRISVKLDDGNTYSVTVGLK
jgi:hypothetical protein